MNLRRTATLYRSNSKNGTTAGDERLGAMGSLHDLIRKSLSSIDLWVDYAGRRDSRTLFGRLSLLVLKAAMLALLTP